jgi:hypothetical protein
MYRIIGGDEKEYGPVTAEDLRRWVAEGRLNAQSLVQAEGSSEWKQLSTFPEFADLLRAQASPPPLPTAAGAPGGTAAWTEQILARQPEVQVGQCLGRSWRLVTANFGVLLGATGVAWLITFACQFIPLVGGIVTWLIQGVLYGGVYLVFLNRIRGRPASVGEVFAGFSMGFAQLMLAGFLTKLLTVIGLACCLLLPGLYLWVAWIFSVPLVADQRLEFWSAMELSRKVVTRVWFEMFALLVVAFLPVILAYVFVQVCIFWTTYPAIRDLMVAGPPDFNHLRNMFLQVAKVSIPLTLLFKLVLLFNLPFALGALMHAYEDLFGARTARPA